MNEININFNEKESKFRSFYQQNLEVFNSAVRTFETLVHSLVVDEIEIDSVSSRVKNLDECIHKFKRKYLSKFEESDTDYEVYDSITDLLGVRIVCLYVSDFDKIKELLEENFKEIGITDKTALIESTENQFGYKGLHLDLKLNESREQLHEYRKFKDLRFELQIRTIIQDAWSVLDHKIKYKKSIPNSLKRRINRLSALFEVADEEFLRIKNETIEESDKAGEEFLRIKDETIEESTNSKSEIEQSKDIFSEKISVFSFLKIANGYFKDYLFEESRADNFVEEILKINPDYRPFDLYIAIAKNIEIVNEYSSTEHKYLNPYTTLRHIIYNSDSTVFKEILYPNQRHTFDLWKSHTNS
ncbi:(p)ppGpp synthetase [Emticicia aquatilis]|uniref:(P)ppGpp synthetase n=1 Tax=Emticicia aquatilis TaxID=1537369 RepID=A0A916Z2F6_9BACT|nr:(p)ppGpp synthetase [Emticicia aquatilis]GGD72884.1 (p)ppGpp synthetase [Emticicia aquatilis]